MKHIQGVFFVGYVTISVTGESPELYFQKCVNEGIPVWDINKISNTVCEGNIKFRDVSKIKQIKHHTEYTITILEKKGIPFLFKKLFKRKELLVSMVISCLFILFLSNIIWEVRITGVSKEMEEKINLKLDEYGVYIGKFTLTLDTPSAIQNKLINDIPELLWIGVHKKGTTFQLEGVEKTIVENPEVYGPQHLIAKKSGVITSLYIEKGLPLVKVNDFVKKGDLLVSGIMDLREKSEEDEADDNESTPETVAANGEVWASTWYEIAVTVPFKTNYELITDNKKNQYDIQLGKVRLPIWGFSKPAYEDTHIDVSKTPLYLFKWELPVKLIKTILSEKMYNELERSKEEAIQVGILQAKKELRLQIDPNIKILNEKILHESVVNGKINLKLHFTVEENIVKVESITQGD